MKGTLTVIVGLVLVVGVGLAVGRWPMINAVETGKTPEYPDLLPRLYQANADRVFDAALHAVHRLPRWSLVSYRPEEKEIQAEARTLVFRFVDDVLIRVVDEGSASAVHVRSVSRVGRGDFGQNARNVRTLFDELDRQVAQSSDHR